MSMAPKILVVDDDSNILELIQMRLESLGYEVTAASSEADAREAVKKNGFELAIIDLQLVEEDGITLMKEFITDYPDLLVIILTAHGSIESAVEAMREGAFTYLTKPFDARELALQIERALEKRELSSEIGRLRGLLSERYDFGNIVARSEGMGTVLETVSRIADTDSTVYIHGESGTGKELIAKAIHLASERKNGPFVAINCAALPETLLESELFGHERGAFTGAIKTSKGLFLKAHNGSIFLDEIGDMPMSIQAKLLRVLQERKFYPVGSEEPVEVDVRVIVATNKDLQELVEQGLFRQDLFYRIHVIPINLPPLRERREDIPALVDQFVREFTDRMGKKIKGLSNGAMKKLMRYDWPGNIRELKNVIEYAIAMTTKSTIDEDLVLPSLSQGDSRVVPLKEAREEFEKNYIINILKYTRGNVSSAAELSGKYRADLYNLMKKYDIRPADFKD